MAILVPPTSLPLRAHSHVRICLPVLYGDAPLSPRVWAHHSPSPKRNLRKGWFFELCFFFCGRLNSTRFYSILLLLLNSTRFRLNSTRFYSILLDSTQFYCFYSISVHFDSILLDATQLYWIQDPTSIPLHFDSILLNYHEF